MTNPSNTQGDTPTDNSGRPEPPCMNTACAESHYHLWDSKVPTTPNIPIEETSEQSVISNLLKDWLDSCYADRPANGSWYIQDHHVTFLAEKMLAWRDRTAEKVKTEPQIKQIAVAQNGCHSHMKYLIGCDNCKNRYPDYVPTKNGEVLDLSVTPNKEREEL